MSGKSKLMSRKCQSVSLTAGLLSPYLLLPSSAASDLRMILPILLNMSNLCLFPSVVLPNTLPLKYQAESILSPEFVLLSLYQSFSTKEMKRMRFYGPSTLNHNHII